MHELWRGDLLQAAARQQQRCVFGVQNRHLYHPDRHSTVHPLLGRHLRRRGKPKVVLAVPSTHNHQRHRRGGPARMRVPGTLWL